MFAENTGLVVGRTLVDPSGWRVPVLVSNFSQETVMVEPFSRFGMIAQVSAIQLVMDKPYMHLTDPAMLPDHLQDMLNLTSENLDSVQKASWRIHYCSYRFVSSARFCPDRPYGRCGALH